MNRGVQVGGIDYSESLLNVANYVLATGDLTTGEAIDMDPEDKKYDVVMSDSVFAYFVTREYAQQVLEKMYLKANNKIVILELLDSAHEEECYEYRRSQIEDYDVRYKGLYKQSYPRELFCNFAKEHNCDIEFTDVKNEFYWNSKYMYNCIITKRCRKKGDGLTV